MLNTSAADVGVNTPTGMESNLKAEKMKFSSRMDVPSCSYTPEPYYAKPNTPDLPESDTRKLKFHPSRSHGRNTPDRSEFLSRKMNCSLEMNATNRSKTHVTAPHFSTPNTSERSAGSSHSDNRQHQSASNSIWRPFSTGINPKYARPSPPDYNFPHRIIRNSGSSNRAMCSTQPPNYDYAVRNSSQVPNSPKEAKTRNKSMSASTAALNSAPVPMPIQTSNYPLPIPSSSPNYFSSYQTSTINPANFFSSQLNGMYYTYSYPYMYSYPNNYLYSYSMPMSAGLNTSSVPIQWIPATATAAAGAETPNTSAIVTTGSTVNPSAADQMVTETQSNKIVDKITESTIEVVEVIVTDDEDDNIASNHLQSVIPDNTSSTVLNESLSDSPRLSTISHTNSASTSSKNRRTDKEEDNDKFDDEPLAKRKRWNVMKMARDVQCFKCLKTFTRRGLGMHMRKKHNEFQCSYCFEKFEMYVIFFTHFLDCPTRKEYLRNRRTQKETE